MAGVISSQVGQQSIKSKEKRRKSVERKREGRWEEKRERHGGQMMVVKKCRKVFL